MVKRKHRDNWKRNLHNTIDDKKDLLKQEASRLDKYGAGKLVGVYIRDIKKKYTTNKIKECVEKYIEEHIGEIIFFVIQERLLNDTGGMESVTVV